MSGLLSKWAILWFDICHLKYNYFCRNSERYSGKKTLSSLIWMTAAAEHILCFPETENNPNTFNGFNCHCYPSQISTMTTDHCYGLWFAFLHWSVLLHWCSQSLIQAIQNANRAWLLFSCTEKPAVTKYWKHLFEGHVSLIAASRSSSRPQSLQHTCHFMHLHLIRWL